MAYKSSYNPDALPAHAEPDQAANMLANQMPRPLVIPSKQGPQRPQGSPNPISPGSFQQPAYHKPTPSPPNQLSTSPYQKPSYQPQPYQGKPSPAPPVNLPPPSPHQQQPYQQAPYQQPAYQQQTYQSKPQPAAPQTAQQLQTQAYRRPSPSSPNMGPTYLSNEAPSQNLNHRQSPQLQPYRNTTPSSQPHRGSVGTTDASLFPLFKAVDKRGTGQLSEDELRAALVNGDFTSFDQQTVRMMIRMFDHDHSGSIGFEEFCGLWGFLAAWRTLFERFDEDASGTISYDEYTKALLAFGYHLSPSFVTMMYRLYDKRGMNSMSFDIFVQSCISLKRMTDVFKKYDSDRDGFITLSFEEFLTEILSQR